MGDFKRRVVLNRLAMSFCFNREITFSSQKIGIVGGILSSRIDSGLNCWYGHCFCYRWISDGYGYT